MRYSFEGHGGVLRGGKPGTYLMKKGCFEAATNANPSLLKHNFLVGNEVSVASSTLFMITTQDIYLSFPNLHTTTP